jgi:hypothetical protein
MILCTHQSVQLTDLLTAIGTVGAVIVAIFLPIIQHFLNKPKLKVGLNFSPPDCHITLAKRGDNYIDVFLMRFFVQNKGRSTAKNLEVTVDKIFLKSNGDWEICSNFLSSNLLWTNQNGSVLNNLLPKSRRNVDLAYIYKPVVSVRNQDETEMVVCISNIIFDDFNRFYPGDYKFVIIVGGSNCDPITKEFIISFKEDWESEALLIKSIVFNIK